MINLDMTLFNIRLTASHTALTAMPGHATAVALHDNGLQQQFTYTNSGLHLCIARPWLLQHIAYIATLPHTHTTTSRMGHCSHTRSMNVRPLHCSLGAYLQYLQLHMLPTVILSQQLMLLCHGLPFLLFTGPVMSSVGDWWIVKLVTYLQGCTAEQCVGLWLRHTCGPRHPVHGGCSPCWVPHGQFFFVLLSLTAPHKYLGIDRHVHSKQVLLYILPRAIVSCSNALQCLTRTCVCY